MPAAVGQVQVEAPTVSPEVIAVAEKAVAEGRYDDAKLLVERVLLSDPANPRARLAMAEIQLAFHNLGAAEKAFAALTQLPERSEEHTSELQSLMRISYAVFCLKKKKKIKRSHRGTQNALNSN